MAYLKSGDSEQARQHPNTRWVASPGIAAH
jgi:hypothetical protein